MLKYLKYYIFGHQQGPVPSLRLLLTQSPAVQEHPEDNDLTEGKVQLIHLMVKSLTLPTWIQVRA